MQQVYFSIAMKKSNLKDFLQQPIDEKKSISTV